MSNRVTLVLLFLTVLIGVPMLAAPDESHAICQATAIAPTMSENATMGAESCDLAANVRTTLGTCISGESACIGDSPLSYIVTRKNMLSSAELTADGQVKASAGYASHMICAGTDAASVAGTIILYDSLTETGTVIYTFRVAALDYHIPITFPLDYIASTGLYLGYTTTTDVNCTVFYR